MPNIEGIGPNFAIDTGCHLMSAGTEVAVDEGVGREEVLGLPGRFEPLHLALSSSRWTMRVLGPIIQISTLSMFDAGKQLTLSNAIAPQLVGHDHTWSYGRPVSNRLKKRFAAWASRRA